MLLLVGIRVAVEDCIALLLSRLNHMREFFIYVSHLFSDQSFRLWVFTLLLLIRFVTLAFSFTFLFMM